MSSKHNINDMFGWEERHYSRNKTDNSEVSFVQLKGKWKSRGEQ